jgi:AcrR family transcriptional regulator
MYRVYDKFYNLTENKQHKIINAALKVFSKTTFKKASTDEIVTEAGISKGALFHYFKNKKNLFIFLYDYAKDLLLKEFYGKVDFNEKDIFKRFESILMIKLTLMQKHPDMFNFMIKAMYDNPQLRDELQHKNNDAIAENIAIILFSSPRPPPFMMSRLLPAG